MRLAVFGATGRTGRLLVQRALDAGHQVVALVRSPDRMPIRHERLTLLPGDAMNAADVEKAVQGAEAVLSLLGPSRGSPPGLMAAAGRNIVAAMRGHGVRRLVAMTGAGVAAPQDRPKLFNHLIKFALKTFSPDVLRDSEAYADAIRASDLDWVLVRVPVLADGPPTGRYRVGWVGVNSGVRATRANVADFLLSQLTDDTYLRQAPVVSDR